jgi:hypothetical protein
MGNELDYARGIDKGSRSSPRKLLLVLLLLLSGLVVLVVRCIVGSCWPWMPPDRESIANGLLWMLVLP